MSVAPLYCFANPAGRAIYITIDDGWTPSAEVLALMHQTYLPITAFLIAKAASEDLSYWKAFVAAGGMIGDHTVSHPYLTKLTLAVPPPSGGRPGRRSVAGWARPPPGAPAVRGLRPHGGGGRRPGRADGPGGLERHHIGQPHPDLERQAAEPGRDRHPALGPGLGHQLTVLLAAIRALHLNPTPLTPASFAGIAPQQHSLSGD